MCGLALALRHDDKSAGRSVWKRYQKQRARGSDGFGFVSVDTSGRTHVGRSTTERHIGEQLAKRREGIVLFHHRYPTSLPNIVEATHPIEVAHPSFLHDYYIMHNGVISNDTELREQHQKAGFGYTTECQQVLRHGGRDVQVSVQWNDSEAFAIELARAIESGAERIEVHGSVAYIALAVDKHTGQARRVLYGRNERNPLVRNDAPDMLMLASEGHGRHVEPHTLNIIELANGKEHRRPLRIGDMPVQQSLGFRWPCNADCAPEPYMNESGYILLCAEYERVKKELANVYLRPGKRMELEEEAEDLACEIAWYEGEGLPPLVPF